MLLNWLTRLENVSVARTEEEKDACARFAYEVYAREMGYRIPGIDHDGRRLWDAHDQGPNAIHLLAGPPDDIRGIMRLLVWGPGEIDEELFKAYSMRQFPGIEELHTAEVGRLMIRPTVRGKLVLPALARAGYSRLAGKHGTDLAFAECRPGLVQHYRRMGLRPYRADPIHHPEGLMIPMVQVLSDREYLRSVNAVTSSQVWQHFGPWRRPTLDLAPFTHLFDEDNQRIVLDTDRIWSSIELRMTEDSTKPHLFDGLSDEDRQAIMQKSAILEVSAGADAAVQDRSERELYVVLDGSFHAMVNGQIVATLTPGESFGEIGFFREAGIRSATVRAASDGRLLLLSRNLLKKLKRTRPEAAFIVLQNLGRILAERLADRSQTPE